MQVNRLRSVRLRDGQQGQPVCMSQGTSQGLLGMA